MIDNSRVCVISGRYPHTQFESYINHKAYCDQHGYSYIHCNWPTGAKNPYFNKIRYLKAYAPYFDYLFWIDDDAFFVDIDKPLDFVFPKSDEFLSICLGPDFKSIKTVISSGQFLLKCNDIGKRFLDALEQTNLELVSEWWKSDLGFFSNGDQDAIIFLMQTNQEFQKVLTHDYRQFNSRIENLEAGEKIFLIHFTGAANRKLTSLKRAQKILGRSQSLLPQDKELGLGIKRPRYNFIPAILKKLVRSLQRRSSTESYIPPRIGSK